MSEKVREQSPTRRQLESSIRALLPTDQQISEMAPGKNTAVSTAGIGGVLTGYIWGRVRGRQVRKRKES
jgi:hypothetical protein